MPKRNYLGQFIKNDEERDDAFSAVTSFIRNLYLIAPFLLFLMLMWYYYDVPEMIKSALIKMICGKSQVCCPQESCNTTPNKIF